MEVGDNIGVDVMVDSPVEFGDNSERVEDSFGDSREGVVIELADERVVIELADERVVIESPVHDLWMSLHFAPRFDLFGSIF